MTPELWMAAGSIALSESSVVTPARSAEVQVAAAVEPLAAGVGLALVVVVVELPHPAASATSATTTANARSVGAAPRRLVSAWRTFTFIHLLLLRLWVSPHRPRRCAALWRPHPAGSPLSVRASSRLA